MKVFIMHLTGYHQSLCCYTKAKLEQVAIEAPKTAKIGRMFNCKTNTYEDVAVIGRDWHSGASVDIDEEVTLGAISKAVKNAGYVSRREYKKIRSVS